MLIIICERFNIFQNMYVLYVMYVQGVGHKIQPLHRDLQWFIILPLLIKPLLILHLVMKCRTLYMGAISKHRETPQVLSTVCVQTFFFSV
jgi:hypothetical protein